MISHETKVRSHPTHSSKKTCLTPEYYLAKLERLNIQHKWGFKASDFPTQIPHFKLLSKDEVMLPVPYFADTPEKTGMQRTFEALWKLARHPKGTNDKHHHGIRDFSSIKLAPGIDYKPGIRWVMINLSAFEGEPVSKLWNSNDSRFLGHIEALTAAVLIDDWLGSSDGKALYCVFLPGYIYYDPETGEAKALLLRFNNETGRLCIEIVSPETRIRGVACPTANRW